MVAVSVLMAVHNGSQFLEEAVASVISQSMTDWELVIVDDASTDATVEIISGFDDTRVRHIRLATRSGLPTALNRGIAECTGQLVARLDADDLCVETRLEEQVAELDRRPTVGVLGSWARVIDEAGRELGTLEVPVGPANVYRSLRWRNALIHPSVTFRRELVLGVGGYDERVLRYQDYELWMRLAAVTKLDNVPRTLVAYRLHPAQLSRGRVSPLRETWPITVGRRRLAASNGESVIAASLRNVAWWTVQMANNRKRDRSQIILRNVSPRRSEDL